MNNNFQEKLAIGTAGEDIVYPWLKANNSLVQDMRYQKHEKGSGPRLEGTEGYFVLPDFAVWNKNPNKGNFLVDVKVKDSIYPVNGKMCFTVDKKFEDYLTGDISGKIIGVPKEYVESLEGEIKNVFEKSLENLEALVEKLESPETPLETVIASFTEGQKLLKVCQKRLREAELVLEKVAEEGK